MTAEITASSKESTIASAVNGKASLKICLLSRSKETTRENVCHPRNISLVWSNSLGSWFHNEEVYPSFFAASLSSSVSLFQLFSSVALVDNPVTPWVPKSHSLRSYPSVFAAFLTFDGSSFHSNSSYSPPSSSDSETLGSFSLWILMSGFLCSFGPSSLTTLSSLSSLSSPSHSNSLYPSISAARCCSFVSSSQSNSSVGGGMDLSHSDAVYPRSMAASRARIGSSSKS
mmetsp:Transcript_4754/g.10567  ORF Transcript_4754/g.10567 Transcript_4754/m.10567 type:complete len:229 (+) Transcript_4754:1552-2238(+)